MFEIVPRSFRKLNLKPILVVGPISSRIYDATTFWERYFEIRMKIPREFLSRIFRIDTMASGGQGEIPSKPTLIF